MAGEFKSPVSVSYVILIGPSGQFWNTATSAFEAGNGTNIANYAITMIQQSTLQIWIGNFPSGITTPGLYDFIGYTQLGSSPAVRDAIVGPGLIQWDGTKVVTPGNLNLSQTGLSPRALDTVADSALTVGDGIVCAIVEAAGKSSIIGTSYARKTPSTGTAVRTFTLDSPTSPTQRN